MTPLTSVVISDDHAPCIQVTPRKTDLATVPNLLWGLMASYGKQTLPALLHDMLCDEASDTKKEGDRQRAYQDRRFADNLIRHALRSTGGFVPPMELLGWRHGRPLFQVSTVVRGAVSLLPQQRPLSSTQAWGCCSYKRFRGQPSGRHATVPRLDRPRAMGWPLTGGDPSCSP